MTRHRSECPYGQRHIPLSMDHLTSMPRTQIGPGGADFTVRHPCDGDKPYAHPGCHHVTPVDTTHVMAWSNESFFGADRDLEEHHHWHTLCWKRRLW